MRTIKFRAKTKDGDWFIWQLFSDIVMKGLLEAIDEKTLGQFTGLLDKNSVEIFEGDMFGIYSLTGDYARQHQPVGKVYFDTDLSAFCVECTNGGWRYLHEYLDEGKPEVIGNIHESPKLINQN